MFSDYKLIEFSTKLKSIRCSLGFSRTVVSDLTGINIDTIRKIENGINIPRFDTLELLSHFYKVDLLSLLANYKNHTVLTYYYESINNCIINNNISNLLKLYTEFDAWTSNMTEITLVNHLELVQLKIFFKALYEKYSNCNKLLDIIIDDLISALKITLPAFNLKNWRHNNYGTTEFRILYCLASFLLQNGNYELSNSLLYFMLDKIHFVSYSKESSNVMLVNLCTLISYNHHMTDDHQDALNVANKGISICQEHHIMNTLPLLLSRKGIAMYNLRINNYEVYLNQAITLLQIQGNYELAEKYSKINIKYGA